MVSSTSKGSREFFETFRNVLEQHRASREGQFTVVCLTQQNGGSRFFKLRINGFRADPFCFSPRQLDSYLSLRQIDTETNKLFFFGEDQVINILKNSGFGKVEFVFSKERQNKLAVLCYTTVSHRTIFSISKWEARKLIIVEILLQKLNIFPVFSARRISY